MSITAGFISLKNKFLSFPWLSLCGEKIKDNPCLLLFVCFFKNTISCLIDSLTILFSLFRHTLLPAFEEIAMATFILFAGCFEERRLALNFLSVEIIVLPFLNTLLISFLPFSPSKILTSFLKITKCFYSSLTVNFFLPFALLLARTFLPSLVFILSLKPCLFFLFLLLGWYVLFILFLQIH